MDFISTGVKKYTESPSLLLYQDPIESTETEEIPKVGQIKKIVHSEIDSNPNIKSTLNSMFLPKEWEEDGKRKISYVSGEPASREKARDLYKALDEKIKEKQAREKGICPVREELYSQCFDEIIRQVTIECPERGLLLLRVRDEIKMTIAAYQTLYDSAVQFGIKKQLQAVKGIEELKLRKAQLEQKKAELTNVKIQLRNKQDAYKKHISEKKKLFQENRDSQLKFLKQQNESLEKYLNSIEGGK